MPLQMLVLRSRGHMAHVHWKVGNPPVFNHFQVFSRSNHWEHHIKPSLIHSLRVTAKRHASARFGLDLR